ncbi:hypothetical protein [Pseudoroseicyclus sp. CXY001]|uniref:hypothetical protein n=1 Tax=Pseudoroseicyclus sp. CXY001 TaxID=3242492 RepID=UPI0035713F37
MIRPAPLLALALALGLAGCASWQSSRLNPMTWFGGGSVQAAAAPSGPVRPLVEPGQVGVVADARAPIATVTAVEIAPTSTGAIVRATGTAAGPGWYNAELVRIGIEGSVLRYQFRAEAPEVGGTGVPVAARQITAADLLTAAELAGITGVRVEGASNALQARR